MAASMLRIVILCFSILLASSTAWGQSISYFGISGGITSGGKFTDFENETCILTEPIERSFLDYLFPAPNTARGCKTVIHNLDFKGLDAGSGGAWGIKYGFYRERFPFVAIEFNYFERYPDVARQPVSANGPNTTSLFPTLPFSGSIEMDIEAVRTLSVSAIFRPLARLPIKSIISRFRPYLGIGFAFTVVSIDSVLVYDNFGTLVGRNNKDSSALGVGFPISVGIDIFLTDSISLSSEYIFSQALSLDFANLDTLGKTSTHYFDHTFMFGLKIFWGGSK